MVVIEVVDKEINNYNVSEVFTPYHSYILGTSCNSDKTRCSPYKATFLKGKYRFELWGSGSSTYHNGGYVSGEINIENTLTLYLVVGAERSYFNSVDIKGSNGTLGNGATDIRLFYNGDWSSFDSLRSRIIVAGAGGNGNGMHDGDKYGYCNASGLYGFAGGLIGYTGLNQTCPSSIEKNTCNPGFPGSQKNGGKGGYGGLLNIEGTGGVGKFGIGGSPGKSCRSTENSKSRDGYAGSGGYYGSGGSSGGIAGYDSPTGTSGGSSFISGHRGCDAISFDSTENNIFHTGLPWHCSGVVFGNSLMIDGFGKRWTNETICDAYRMPSIKERKTYSEGKGHPGSGFIKITILSCRIMTQKQNHSHLRVFMFVIIHFSS